MTQANVHDLVGRTIAGTYRVEKKLGEGGMGAVYRALDVKLERPVALKVMRPELGSTPDFVMRFHREAKAAARFKHRHSVDVYAFGEDEGLLYMALEFVEGRELREVIKEGALAPDRAIGIAVQMLSALQKAHEQGIVHRDLKPQNVMVSVEDGEESVKILDFGVAKMAHGDAGGLKTQAGTIMGTVAYMSPEQAQGEEVDARSDLYAVGVIVYQMLTGVLPFQGRSAMEVIKQQIGSPPPPLRSKRPDIPEPLERIVLKALEKRVQERFQDARSFAQALESVRGVYEATVVGSVPTGSLPRGTPVPPTAPGTNVPTSVDVRYEPGGTAKVYQDLVGRTIDEKYEILSKLGEGGMGAVFKARLKLLDKLVALKVVHPALSDRGDVRERFLREAKAAMEFVHPNAVPVRDFGVSKQGLLYMTQDFSPGKSLRALISEAGRFPPPRALGLVRQCLLALGEAHAHGIVHRDVKPENILVESDEATGEDIPRVCDFGIAKLSESAAVDRKGESLTGHAVIGTPHYMAPEQASGEKVDARADLYAIGCVLYELLTGKKVFDATSVVQVIMKQVSQAPEPPSSRAEDIPPALDALVLRVLSKEPAARPQTAEEMIEAIDALGYVLPGRGVGRTRKATSSFVAPSPPSRGSGAKLVVFALVLVAAAGLAVLGVLKSGHVPPEVASVTPTPVPLPTATRDPTPTPAPSATETPQPATPTPTSTPDPEAAKAALAEKADKAFSRADGFYADAQKRGMVGENRDMLRKLFQEIVDGYPETPAADMAWKRLEELHEAPTPSPSRAPSPEPTRQAPPTPSPVASRPPSPSPESKATPSATPRTPPPTPQPTASQAPTPSGQPRPSDTPGPAYKPGSRHEVKLAWGVASFVAVKSGSTTVLIQERAVTVGEYLKFVSAMKDKRPPEKDWKRFVPPESTAIGKEIYAKVEIERPTGRTTVPKADIARPPQELAEKPIDGITADSAKAFAAWAKGRLPTPTEIRAAASELSDIASSEKAWTDEGLHYLKGAHDPVKPDEPAEGATLRLKGS